MPSKKSFVEVVVKNTPVPEKKYIRLDSAAPTFSELGEWHSPVKFSLVTDWTQTFPKGTLQQAEDLIKSTVGYIIKENEGGRSIWSGVASIILGTGMDVQKQFAQIEFRTVTIDVEEGTVVFGDYTVVQAIKEDNKVRATVVVGSNTLPHKNVFKTEPQE